MDWTIDVFHEFGFLSACKKCFFVTLQVMDGHFRLMIHIPIQHVPFFLTQWDGLFWVCSPGGVPESRRRNRGNRPTSRRRWSDSVASPGELRMGHFLGHCGRFERTVAQSKIVWNWPKHMDQWMCVACLYRVCVV